MFGKTLLCGTLETGTSLARVNKLNCVTLDGDQVNAKGAITGGFIDTRTSRLKWMREIRNLQSQKKAAEEELSKIQAKSNGMLSLNS